MQLSLVLPPLHSLPAGRYLAYPLVAFLRAEDELAVVLRNVAPANWTEIEQVVWSGIWRGRRERYLVELHIVPANDATSINKADIFGRNPLRLALNTVHIRAISVPDGRTAMAAARVRWHFTGLEERAGFSRIRVGNRPAMVSASTVRQYRPDPSRQRLLIAGGVNLPAAITSRFATVWDGITLPRWIAADLIICDASALSAWEIDNPPPEARRMVMLVETRASDMTVSWREAGLAKHGVPSVGGKLGTPDGLLAAIDSWISCQAG